MHVLYDQGLNSYVFLFNNNKIKIQNKKRILTRFS